MMLDPSKIILEPGWYYYDSEDPDGNSCGPFDTEKEALDHAEDSEYDMENVETWYKDPYR